MATPQATTGLLTPPSWPDPTVQTATTSGPPVSAEQAEADPDVVDIPQDQSATGGPPSWPTPTPPPPEEGGGGGAIWQPTGTMEQDPFKLDTQVASIGTEDPEYYEAQGGLLASEVGQGVSRIGPDGQVIIGDTGAATREVQPGELVSEQLSGLLASDSKYMQDARRQGLEQANAMGGLGGTAGVGASMTAALRAGLPIAQQDAQTMTQAAAQNMQALNQFNQLNLQRATQLEAAGIDARTRTELAKMGTSASIAQSKLQAQTQKDLGRLSAETQLRATEMGGMIQSRLADLAFQYTGLLNDQQNVARLRETTLQGMTDLQKTDLMGKWQDAIEEKKNAMQAKSDYIRTYMTAYGGYMDRLANLNGLDLDEAGRKRAEETIAGQFQAEIKLLAALHPDMPEIPFG